MILNSQKPIIYYWLSKILIHLSYSMINNDISHYFNSKINALSEDIQNKNIYSEYALIELKEIDRYNLISYDDYIISLLQ